ncbi:MAG: MaoC family dehydratase [Rhodospirillales bacterium]|nr:MaoC family dehydratase [Rhodospirillales bacterium]
MLEDNVRYFEDYVVGAVHDLGTVSVSESEIIDFARQFDNQLFHVDPTKAQESMYGGIIASGWHTGSMMMSLLATKYLSEKSSLGSPGVKELRWLAPVRPNDVLTVRVTITDARTSSSKPDRGIVISLIEVINQSNVVVMDMTATNFIARKKAK